jgi:hypothetical protein
MCTLHCPSRLASKTLGCSDGPGQCPVDDALPHGVVDAQRATELVPQLGVLGLQLGQPIALTFFRGDTEASADWRELRLG